MEKFAFKNSDFISSKISLCLNCSIVYKDLRKVETDGVICATFVNVFDNVFSVKKEVCGADSVSKKSVCL